MSERVRYEFASVELARGWKLGPNGTSESGVVRRHPAFLSFVVVSERGEGTFEIDPIEGKVGDPVLDLPTLRERVHRAIDCYESLVSKPFDCVDWEVEVPSISCHGFTVVWRTEDPKYDPSRPLIQRQWHIISGVDTVVASYKNRNGDDVARDIFDCEEMVRSLRFEPPSKRID